MIDKDALRWIGIVAILAALTGCDLVEGCGDPVGADDDDAVDDDTIADDDDDDSVEPTGLLEGRGTWFWGDSESVWGSIEVVGDPVQEDLAIAHMLDHDIHRVYGSYQNRPVSEPGVIAAWNHELDDHGIDSCLLLSGAQWVCDSTGLLEDIQERLVDFHAAFPDPADRFDALHLDVEPQALDGDDPSCPHDWGALTVVEKRDLLEQLVGVFDDVRDELDASGEGSLAVYVDVPAWYDNVSTGSFNWGTEEARDLWFDDLAGPVDGISIMAFCREDEPTVTDGIAWELTGFDGEVRAGLAATHLVGAGLECETWVDVAAMLAVAEDVETVHGPSIGVDIQSFSGFVEGL